MGRKSVPAKARQDAASLMPLSAITGQALCQAHIKKSWAVPGCLVEQGRGLLKLSKWSPLWDPRLSEPLWLGLGSTQL